MPTYALFIATDPDPVSSSDWSHLDQVYDHARHSSGGTLVKVRATEGTGTAPEDFDIDIATFVNGIQLEQRDDGPNGFSYLADGDVIGTVALEGDQWRLTRVADDAGHGGPVAHVDAAGSSREDAGVRLGKIVEDWLS